jgi:hypothetical protein
LARVCLAQVTLTGAFYMIAVQFNQGHGWGARYFLPVLPSLALGIFHVLDEGNSTGNFFRSYIFAASLLMLVVVIPARLVMLEQVMAAQIRDNPLSHHESR